MTLSDFLFSEMKKRNLSRAEFTAQVGLHPAEMGRLLTGKKPSKTVWDKLIAFGLDIQNIEFEYDTTKRATSSPPAQTQLLQEAYPHDLIKRYKLTYNDIASAFRANDMTMTSEPTHLGEPDQWAEIYRVFPKATKVFFFDEKGKPDIIGDWSFVFPAQELLEQICAEGFNDDKISINNIQAMNLRGTFPLYLLNLGFNTEHNTVQNVGILTASFLNELLSLAREGVYVEKMYVNTLPQNRAFFSSLGFHPIHSSCFEEIATYTMAFPDEFTYNDDERINTLLADIKIEYLKHGLK